MSNDLELKLVLRATDQGLSGVVREVKGDTEALNKALDDTAQSATKAERGHKELSGSLNKSGQQAKQSEHQVKSLNKEVDKNAGKSKKAATESKEFGNTLKDGAAKAGTWAAALTTASGQQQEFSGRLEKSDSAVRNTTHGISGLTAVVSGLVASLSMREILAYSDSYTSLQNQLRDVTGSIGELMQVNQQLDAIAEDSRASLSSTINLYARLDRSTSELGLSQATLLETTETINKAFALSGATTLEADAAIIQLSQGLAAGALRGDEFNSVAEQAPEIMRAIATHLGLTIGQLREFAAEGGITADIVVGALGDAADAIDQRFGQSVATFGQRMQQAEDNVMQFLGTSKDVQAFTDLMGAGVVSLSENIDDIMQTLTVVGSLAAAYWTVNTAIRAATVAQLALNAATMANPIGMLAKGLAVAGTALAGYVMTSDAGVGSVNDLTSALESNTTAVNDNATATSQNAQAQLSASVATSEAHIARLRATNTEILATIATLEEQRQRFSDNKDMALAYAASIANAALSMQGNRDQIDELTGSIERMNKALLGGSNGDGLPAGITDAQQKLIDLYAGQIPRVEKLTKHMEELYELQERYPDQARKIAVGIANINRQLKEEERRNKKKLGQNDLLIQQMEDELELIGLTNRDREIEIALRKLDADATDGQKDKIRELTGTLYDHKEELKRNEEAAKVWSTITDNAIQSVDDSFRELFRSGLDGWDNFWDQMKSTAKDMLAELAYTLVKEKLWINVGLNVSGQQAAGGSGSSDFSKYTSALTNKISPVNSFALSPTGASLGLSSATPAPTSAFQASNYSPYQLTSTGEFLTAAPTDLTSGLATAGAGYLGANLGKSFGFEGGYSNELSSIYSAVGGAVAGPIGAAAGGFLGSAWGSLLGPKPSDKTQWAGFTGADNRGFSGGFDGKKFSQENRSAAEQMAGVLNTFNQALDRYSGSDFKTAMQVQVGSRDGVFVRTAEAEYTGQLNRNADGTSASVAGGQNIYAGSDPKEALNSAIEYMAEKQGVLLDVYRELAAENELLGDTYMRLNAQEEIVRQALDALEIPFTAVGDSALKIADQLVEAAGGIETFQTQAGYYYGQFYTEEERKQQVLDTVTGQVSEWNETLELTGSAAIDTRAEFRQYIESLDLTTEAGQRAWASAMQLAPALVALEQVSATVKEAARQQTKQEIAQQLTVWQTTEQTLATMQRQVAQFNAELSRTGDQYIDTRSEMAAYLNALDTSTESGQAAATAALELSAAIESVEAAALAASQSAEQVYSAARRDLITALNTEIADASASHQALANTLESARQTYTNAIQAQISGINQQIAAQSAARNEAEHTAAAWTAAAETLADTRQDLLQDTYAPEQSLTNYKNQFETTLQQVWAGNVGAVDQLTNLVGGYRDTLRESAGSGTEFRLETARVAAQLDTAQSVATRNADAQQRLVSAADTQIESLTQQIQQLENQHKALLGVQNQVVSIDEAARAFYAAQAAFQADDADERADYYRTELNALDNVSSNVTSLADAYAVFSAAEQNWLRQMTAEQSAQSATLRGILQGIRAIGAAPSNDERLPQFANGGIATGPTSGYKVELHGTEAVIPLTGGSIPVDINQGALLVEIRALRQEVAQLRDDNRRLGGEQAKAAQKTTKVLAKWDADGQPAQRNVG